MARMPRYAVPGFPQHVTQRGNNRSVMFAARSDYHFFLECLRTACERHHCHVHAYVLMTNHVHVLLTPLRSASIPRVMQSVGRRYVGYFNRQYGRTGTLWEGRYHATLVDSERYLLACHRYIEFNPVRAAMVADPGDYAWSSYCANALGAFDPLVTPHPSYRALGSDHRSRQAAYRRAFAREVGEPALAEIRRATSSGWALGGDRFCDEIARLTGRRTRPLPKGRRGR